MMDIFDELEKTVDEFCKWAEDFIKAENENTAKLVKMVQEAENVLSERID